MLLSYCDATAVENPQKWRILQVTGNVVTADPVAF